jgi:hypothetical protein
VNFQKLTDSLGLNWVVVLVVPESDFISSFSNGIIYTLLAVLAISLFFVAVSAVFTNFITRPIMAIAKNMVALASLKFEVLHNEKARYIRHSRLYELSCDCSLMLTCLKFRLEVSAIQKAFSRLHLAMHSFKRYVPEQLVRFLLGKIFEA